MFGTENGEYVGSFKTAWESLLLIANGHETKRAKPGHTSLQKLARPGARSKGCIVRFSGRAA